jgi:hypothetical protein
MIRYFLAGVALLATLIFLAVGPAPAPVGDGKVNDQPALQQLLDDVTQPIINLPAGVFACDAPLIISRTVQVRGAGRMATILLFRKGTAGLTLTRDVAGNGDWCVIEGLSLRGSRGADGAGISIHAGRTTIRDVTVKNFPGPGIYAAGPPDMPGPAGANLWRLERVESRGNGSDGVRVVSANANAGVADQVSCIANKGWGFYEGASAGSKADPHGNGYRDCHTAANTLGGYSIGGNNSASLLTRCYAEPDQPPSELGQRTIAIGGNFPDFKAGMLGHVIRGDWQGFRNSRSEYQNFHGGGQVRFASAPPASGDWTDGTVLLNRNARAGQPVGWFCTKSGSPGTWIILIKANP